MSRHAKAVSGAGGEIKQGHFFAPPFFGGFFPSRTAAPRTRSARSRSNSSGHCETACGVMSKARARALIEPKSWTASDFNMGIMKAYLQDNCKHANSVSCNAAYMEKDLWGATVAERLRAAMDAKSEKLGEKYGPVRLAKDIGGISPQAISQWLSGATVPEGRNLHGAAEALGVTVEWLDEGRGQPRPVAAIADEPDDYGGGILLDYMNVPVAAGRGATPPAVERVIERVRVSETWLRRNFTISRPGNICLLQAIGDSMHPTFNDGDILFVDTGVKEIRLDAVYVLCIKGELFVKRVQRRPGGEIVVMKSDNPFYDPITVPRDDSEFSIEGRVIWVWNGRKL